MPDLFDVLVAMAAPFVVIYGLAPLGKILGGVLLLLLDAVRRAARPGFLCRLGWHERPRLFGAARSDAWICRRCSRVIPPRGHP